MTRAAAERLQQLSRVRGAQRAEESGPGYSWLNLRQTAETDEDYPNALIRGAGSLHCIGTMIGTDWTFLFANLSVFVCKDAVAGIYSPVLLSSLSLPPSSILKS